MPRHERFRAIPGVIRRKPLQAGKFGGILLALVLGIGGLFRVVDATAIVNDPLLGDGQFLALVSLPLVSFGLVLVVSVETLAAGYRALRSDEPIGDRIAGRPGYLAIRGAEAAVAIAGVVLIAAALPPLFADATPAPAGVGIMLLLAAVALGILFASFVRSTAELFVYTA